MRLKRAHSLEDYEQDDVSDFGDRESRREARRQRKRERKVARAERKTDRRLARVQRRKGKVRQRMAVPSTTPAPSLQPAPMTRPPPQRQPGPLLDRAVQWVEDFVEEEEEPLDEELEEEDPEEATEGIGAAWSPFRQAGAGQVWGPAVQMGRRLRIQAAVGHRAAVIELKPGLFLVAEMPEAVTRTEFGLAPLLAPMMMKAARRSMDEPQDQRRGPFARLFRRRQREEPIRYVAVVQPAAPAASPALALPGPVENGAMMVPAPNVGWADDATVAAVYGCDACEHRGRR